jgi:kumamolisin
MVTAWSTAGGTSLSAPSWAGFLALVNQARATAGKGPLPFLAPIVYRMPPAERSGDFHDIVNGSNGFYNALAGWDAVTGWGSPKGAELLKYLVSY